MNWRKSSASAGTNCVEVASDWRKSSQSTFNGNCVEAAGDGGVILVRDTADRDGAVVRFPAQAWRAFLQYVRVDE